MPARLPSIDRSSGAPATCASGSSRSITTSAVSTFSVDAGRWRACGARAASTAPLSRSARTKPAAVTLGRQGGAPGPTTSPAGTQRGPADRRQRPGQGRGGDGAGRGLLDGRGRGRHRPRPGTPVAAAAGDRPISSGSTRGGRRPRPSRSAPLPRPQSRAATRRAQRGGRARSHRRVTRRTPAGQPTIRSRLRCRACDCRWSRLRSRRLPDPSGGSAGAEGA